MFVARPVQLTSSSVMTLPIFSFGLTGGNWPPNAPDPLTTYMKIGYTEDPNPLTAFTGSADAFETVTWTAGPEGANLVVGLGGQAADTYPQPDPNPRVSFAPDPSTIIYVPSFIDYVVWVGPATLRLYFSGDEMVCEWRDANGHLVMTDRFPAQPEVGYAAILGQPSSIGPNAQVCAVYLGEWKVTGGTPVNAPYPFTTEFGDLAGGPGEDGVLRIS